MWGLDLAFADVVATSSDPRLGQIRLAWWSERLDELDAGHPIGGEPKIAGAERFLKPVTNGAELSRIANAWVPLLNPFPWGEEAVAGLRQRGKLLFGVGSEILGCPATATAAAGELWSLVDGALHCSDPQSREFLLEEARRIELPRRAPAELRPLTVLAALAAADLRGKGRAGRAAAAIRHRMSGRFPA